MRALLAGVLVMSLTSSLAAARSPDEAAVMTIVESVGTMADRGEFEALEQLYAPEIALDYTSLAGGEPEVISNTALMMRWAGVLPGFDRTRHALSDLSVSLAGNEATATAKVVADHWLGAMHWQVSGRYAYRLARDGERWRITHHRFVLDGEQGSRDIFGPAIAAAKNRPVAYLARQQARAVVMDFLQGLEQKDMARVNGVWAEDAVQDMPYSPAGFPKRVTGRQALIEFYAGWPANSGKAVFTEGIRFYPTLDPALVIAEFKGAVDVIPTGRHYAQNYIALWHVEGGKVTLYREYFEPGAFAHAFGLAGGTP
jgi:ketosteroid isomerase-like protein